MKGSADPPSTSSSLLVQLRDAGDVEAWRTFVDLYTPPVYRYCRRRGLQDADAQDVLQRVFTQVSQAIRNFEYDPQRGKFRSWLATITSQTIVRQLKKEAQPGQGPGLGLDEQAISALESHVEPDWIDEFNSQVRKVALERIQAEFDPLVWRAFELTWIEDQDSKQAAESVQKTVAWVYKARFKVLKRLRQEIVFLSADTAFYSEE